MTRHRIVAFAAVVAAASLTIAACGGSSDGAASASSAPAQQSEAAATGGSAETAPTEAAPLEGSLSMVTKFADPKYAPYFEAMVAAFQAKNPGVTINLEQVGDQPYKDKIRVLSASGDLPDIFFSWAGDFANKFVRAGLAADLTSEIGAGTEWGSTFAPAALKAFEYDGKNYGVPINLDGKYMVYNKAIFKKAGVAVPATFEELLTACDTLKASGVTPIALGNQYGWPAIHYITQLNAVNVAPETLTADYNPATGAFTDPGYVAALQQFSDLVSRCATPDANGLAHEAAQANFLSGKAAMQFVESVEFPVFTAEGGASPEVADNWSFFRLPSPSAAAGDTGALTGAPDGFLVNAKSENQALALEFLKFFTSQENAAKMTKQIGWLSPVSGSSTPENSFPQLTETLADMGKASQFAIWLDTVTQADVAGAYLSGVEGMLSGSLTPEQVVESVQAAAGKAKAAAQ
jgi:raffinose/stachyose/melibiose transport system substrate-binding protein